MISFKVAELLKEKGFPYLISRSFYDKNGKVKLLSRMHTKGKSMAQLELELTPIVPTDDLLYILGEGLYAIGHQRPGLWEAVGSGDRPVRGRGPSIEDALAMLWVGQTKERETAES